VPSGPPAGARADAWRARVFNLSRAGVGLVLERQFDPGDVLAIDLPVRPPDGSKTVLARVAHATPGPGGTWLVGGAFLRQLDSAVLQVWIAGPTAAGGTSGAVWVRLAPDQSALCKVHGDGSVELWRARVVDVSPGGLGLLAPRAVREGTSLAVELPASGSRPARQLLARVAHLAEQADGTWLLGCEVPEGPDGEGQGGLPSYGGPAAANPLAGASPLVAETDPELAGLCAAWPALPRPVKAAIRALVAATPDTPDGGVDAR
jgi:hypothetical protein